MSAIMNYDKDVEIIKTAILQSQYDAARSVNEKQLMLYYGIGKYISLNSRKGFWGKGAIDAISERLDKELPGLKGFSARNLRYMRTFYLSVLDGFERKPHENPSIGLILCKDMNKSFVDYVIQDYAKPMGVATYKTSKDMSDELRKALPDVEALKKLLDDQEH